MLVVCALLARDIQPDRPLKGIGTWLDTPVAFTYPIHCTTYGIKILYAKNEQRRSYNIVLHVDISKTSSIAITIKIKIEINYSFDFNLNPNVDLRHH